MAQAAARQIATVDPVPYALDIVGLHKSFRRRTLSRGSYTTIKSAALSLFRNRQPAAAEITRAVSNLTLRIPRGASVGVIGRNGSGKSTLLKLITGIYKPDAGTILLNGRVAALIELGAGFHPDFSGRENLMLGGAMHGLSRAEMKARFEEIVRFAELEHVIDDPLRTYSSGMFMRLGFSLAVHTDPDILLVDEVLSVGDAAFVTKCKEKISNLRRAGKTLMLVTHDLEAVRRWCDEALWLDGGKIMDRGDPRRVIDHYLQWLERGEEAGLLADARNETEGVPMHSESSSDIDPEENGEASEEKERGGRWGSREVEITAVHLRGESASGAEERRVFHADDRCVIEIDYILREKLSPGDELVVGISLNRNDGLLVHGTNTDIERIEMPAPLFPRGRVSYRIERLGLLEGSYTLDVAVHRRDGYPYDYHKAVLEFVVRNPLAQLGVCVPPHRWIFEPLSAEESCGRR